MSNHHSQEFIIQNQKAIAALIVEHVITNQRPDPLEPNGQGFLKFVTRINDGQPVEEIPNNGISQTQISKGQIITLGAYMARFLDQATHNSQENEKSESYGAATIRDDLTRILLQDIDAGTGPQEEKSPDTTIIYNNRDPVQRLTYDLANAYQEFPLIGARHAALMISRLSEGRLALSPDKVLLPIMDYRI